jgi:hypothetical protein
MVARQQEGLQCTYRTNSTAHQQERLPLALVASLFTKLNPVLGLPLGPFASLPLSPPASSNPLHVRAYLCVFVCFYVCVHVHMYNWCV